MPAGFRPPAHLEEEFRERERLAAIQAKRVVSAEEQAWNRRVEQELNVK